MITIGRQFQKEHVLHLQEKEIAYLALAQELVFTNDLTGEKEATAFTYAYLKKREPGEMRPVMFAYNGGPGCSCLPIHSALLAPVKAAFGDGLSAGAAGPYRTEENKECLLDVIDIVCIDPVGCGYGKLFETEGKQNYLGTENDCITTARIIQKWLTANQRFGDPVYLCGESYGTTRNALTADYLYSNPQGMPGIVLSGIIMIGSAMDHGQEQYKIFRSVLTLPTLAATHRFYHPEQVKESLSEFVDQALEFAWNDYARAKLYGSFLPEEEQRAIAEKLQYFTGVSTEYLLQHELEIDSFSYKQYLYDTEGFIVSNYDTRFSHKEVPASLEAQMKMDDRDSNICFPAMLSALYTAIRPQFGMDLEEEYMAMNPAFEDQWSFKTKVNPLVSLEKAMQRNPKMKLFFAAGIHDLLTTWGYVRYVQSHNHYPAERTFAKYYPSGHMIYITDSCAEELLRDLREFLEK